jgi:hypothetical protein
MRFRFFTVVTALALAFAVAAAFSTAAGAKTGVKAFHVGKAKVGKVLPHAGALARPATTTASESSAELRRTSTPTTPRVPTKVPRADRVIKEVDVTGVYFDGPGPAVPKTSRSTRQDLPGVVKSVTKVGVDNGLGSFTISGIRA